MAGVAVNTGVDEATGGGGNEGVGVLTRMVTLVPIEGRLVRRLFPCETRASQFTADCPATKPLIMNVNTGPLVAALLPLLPAIATMKLPVCSLMATAASTPKRPVTRILLFSIRLELYVHVNSALV